MKENKDCQIKVRVTPKDKERIESYCANHDLTVSQFLRMAFNEILRKKEI